MLGKWCRGYIFSRGFKGNIVPQKVQNLVIRNYINKHKGNFSLSATELNLPDCFNVLRDQLQQKHEWDVLTLYSLEMIPPTHAIWRDLISFVKSEKKELHFAIEEVVLGPDSDFVSFNRQHLLMLNPPGRERNFFTTMHESAKRNYDERKTNKNLSDVLLAQQFGAEYWDGDRKYGYGGYKYDGRWEPLARQLIDFYHLSEDSSVLDVGCGKGYLLFELKKRLPKLRVRGIDISSYAIENSKEEIREMLQIGVAESLPFSDKSFDLVISTTTLHNLSIGKLYAALLEISRVSRKNAWITVESWRNEEEKINLLNWQLTCQAFFNTEDWKWIFAQVGYEGDYEFISFK